MKVILLRELKGIGRKGEIVDVAEGYARNFLLPTQRAEIATAERIAAVERHRSNTQHEREARDKELGQLAERLAHVRVTIAAASSDKGKLFGRVTATMVCKALAQQGFAVPERAVSIDVPIDHIGNHAITINLSTDHVATITVTVVADTRHA